MCGLVSIIARKQVGFQHMDNDVMEQLLLVDTMRGADSTGVFTVMRDKAVSITKIGSHPLHLFTTAAWSKHRGKSYAQGRIMVGHNRKATMGSVNSENAHPFHENSIVLVHNGTMRGGHKKLADTEVDSHAICHAFNEHGAEEVIKTLDAAFAFIWWDLKKQKLFAVRNAERPLSLVVTDDLYALVSEPWMALGVLGRNGKKVTDVIEIKPGQLFEFDLDGKYVVRDITLRPEPTVVTQTSCWPTNRSNYFMDADDDLDDLPSNTIKDKTVVQIATKQVIDDAMANGNPAITHPNYTRGDTVLLKIMSARVAPSGAKTQVTGTCVEPGKPVIDICGYVPGNPGEMARTLMGNVYVTGEITGIARSNCGPSLWITNLRVAPTAGGHDCDVPDQIWNYILKEGRCKDCGNQIFDSDREFTSVTTKASSEYRITCGDCIENKLPKGAIRNAFTQRRLDALQDGVSIREKPTTTALTVVRKESSATVH